MNILSIFFCLFKLLKPFAVSPKGAFHLSELTGQAIPVVMKISLLIRAIQISQMLNSMHEGNHFSSKTRFHFQMTGPAMVRPASFDIWKAPSFTSISDLSSSLPSCTSCSFYMNSEIMLNGARTGLYCN